MNDFNFIAQGWECPKCKRVYSPTTTMCIACPQYTKSVTTTNTLISSDGTSFSTSYAHQFEADEKNSSATICKICGKEKFLHPNVSHT
jgi:hypothetical protein